MSAKTNGPAAGARLVAGATTLAHRDTFRLGDGIRHIERWSVLRCGAAYRSTSATPWLHAVSGNNLLTDATSGLGMSGTLRPDAISGS
jgi:hypothetical protein